MRMRKILKLDSKESNNNKKEGISTRKNLKQAEIQKG